ncbi:Mycothiol acetyltransferase [Marinomonas spartinae]|uniref:Mycothiol acetyltransferase n=1 Tax=Marinomonas spartinae TaxID=1792290 RepID=A0A1A8TUD4_9GAMM|nr:GNAT family N-acetyltransferase [Marinomonas spartinae]SBS31877.1 Mycothiol acetyltransferase [Marinomonas spartinae]SBS36808.1 Mycothiol acetyltransferase [Marinomonas spartinae]
MVVEHDEKTLLIRLARLNEAISLADCAHLSYKKYVEQLGQRPAPMLEDYIQIIQQHQVWVAEYHHRVVGFAVLKQTEEGYLLDNLAIHPDYQGLGVGGALLRHAEEQARQLGYSSIYLYTHERMLENQALYSRKGYREYERRQEAGYSRVFMRKTL